MTKEEMLKQKLDEYAEKTGYSGITRIVSKGQVIYTHTCGYTDERFTVPVTEDFSFRFYSTTKAFIAIALMHLWDKGLVDLDAHPWKYLPCAKELDGRITVRNVMRHMSGLSDFPSLELLATPGKADLRKKVEELAHIPLAYETEKEALYCNSNYIITGLLVEELSGLRAGQYLEKYIFPAFGMKTAISLNEHPQPEKMALGFDKDEKGNIVPAGYVNMEWFSGCGDTCGTIDDLTQFVYAIREKKLLSKAAWKEIYTPTDIAAFGFGCSVFKWHNLTAYQNNGGHLGYRILQRYLPEEDLSIIILSNAGFGNAREEISEIIYNIYLGTDVNTAALPEMDKGYI